MNVRVLAGLSLSLGLLTACAVQQGYPGPVRDPGEVAVIQGDPRFRLAPAAVYLRMVDGESLGDTRSGMALLPGSHELVADCVVSSSGDRRRVHLQVTVTAGGRYRLEPVLAGANQACADVRLVKH